MSRTSNVVEISFDNYVKDVSYLGYPKKTQNGAKEFNVSKEPPAIKIANLDTLEIVDRSMDIQQILFELSQNINIYFRFQALMVILTAFIIIVFDSYYVLLLFTSKKKRKWFLLVCEIRS